MIETLRLKNVVIFFQAILSFVRSRKILNKDDFKYSSQEFENNELDLVKQKGFYPYEYISDSKKNYLAKKSFIVL